MNSDKGLAGLAGHGTAASLKNPQPIRDKLTRVHSRADDLASRLATLAKAFSPVLGPIDESSDEDVAEPDSVNEVEDSLHSLERKIKTLNNLVGELLERNRL